MRPYRVLIVEDQADNRRLAAKVLQRAGFETIEAERAEGIQELVAEQQPDVILIDIELPGQSGIVGVRRLRADPAAARLPIIAVTAYASADDRQRCLNAGCSDYLAKPLDINVLVDTVRRHLPPT